MKTALSVIFFFHFLPLTAQISISGRVTDNKNKALRGVSVALKNTYDGATTDSTGHYSFSTDEKGEQQLEVTISGYYAISQKIVLGDSPVTLNLSMKEQITELKAVVISAGSFEASDKNKGAVLSDIDIVTTPSANGDVTSAFKSLPGTQQVGESEGLFVRGGTATESKIFMDGNLVNNFFFSSTPGMATRGRFNPFLFKGTIFSTGGYSALYGQALSSALILESKDLPEKTEADLGISVVGVGGGIQHLSKDKKSSWGVSVNYTNLWLAFNVIKQKQDFFQVPLAKQADANFRIKTKNGGFIKYYGYISTNKTGFRSPDIDSAILKDAFSINNINTYQNISWKDRIGNGWKINTGISFSTNKDDIVNEIQDADNGKFTGTNPLFNYKNFNLLNKARYAQARVVFEKKLFGLNAIRFGTDYFYSNEKSTYTLYDGTKFTQQVNDHLLAAFAETDIYVTNNLAAKIGSRLEHSTIIDKWNIAPRISLAYKVGANSQASFAYGIFYQNPERKYLPGLAGLDYSRASHYIFQYSKQTKNYTLRTELFYKKYSNLYKTDSSIGGREIAANNNGYGDARGIEFFWRDKKTIKNVDYWLSYSYLNTKRDFLNYPTAIQPSFAATHTAAFVFKRFFLPLKTQFNLSYNFATGRPYYRIAKNASDKYMITDAGKTINYNSMSFSVNWLPNIGKKDARTFAVWVLGVTNVLGQNIIYNYNYSYEGSRKEAVTPPSKRFVFIGCFLSFGMDRTQDAINNNL
ncbi:MAG: TonB-dependent receptor [Ferruginibacter sp.]|uniref:TonB-dependent receptor n=1 Tax=Ferruginibacter sp. TaxID=1940288 RepID=UPI00265AB3F1|nr:carboxypeptidase-like regulatory domain-containing protein [Ferruginibacter sp.]MDB5275933.1 TonB-dependent receptor [Ferruginibacter sp.]